MSCRYLTTRAFFRAGRGAKPLQRCGVLAIKSLNGYDATREQLDEHNTLTVKQPVEVHEKQHQKSVLY